MTIETNERITALQDWLEQNRAAYKDAEKIIKDPQSVLGLLKVLMLKTSQLMMFDAYKHPAEAAIQEVTRMQERMGGIFGDVEFLEEYEDKREELKREVKRLIKTQPAGEAGLEIDVE